MHSSHTGWSSPTGSHSVIWRRAQRSAGGQRPHTTQSSSGIGMPQRLSRAVRSSEDVGLSGRPARRSVARGHIAPLSYRGSGSQGISDFSASCVEAPGRRRIHHTKVRPPTIQRLTAIKSQWYQAISLAAPIRCRKLICNSTRCKAAKPVLGQVGTRRMGMDRLLPPRG